MTSSVMLPLVMEKEPRAQKSRPPALAQFRKLLCTRCDERAHEVLSQYAARFPPTYGHVLATTRRRRSFRPGLCTRGAGRWGALRPIVRCRFEPPFPKGKKAVHRFAALIIAS